MAVDPITLSVIRGALDSICVEMDGTLSAAAFSPIIAEGCDYGNGLFQADGGVISQGTATLPYFTGLMQAVLKDTLKKIDINDISPGDIYITNDIYWGGSHLMDVRFLKPFFYKNELCAWVCDVGHWRDTGGSAAGGFNPGARDTFTEGLCIPPVKIYTKDKINNDLLKVILNNVRTPKDDYGDLMAQIKTLYIGESRVKNGLDAI